MNAFTSAISLVAGAFCILYGIMFMRAKKRRQFVFLWIGLGLAVGLPGVLFSLGIWQRMPQLVSCIWLAMLAALVLYEVCFFVFAQRHFEDQGTPSLGYLVVLGARVFEYGPSDSFVHRLEAARVYLVENPDTLCIVCGGCGADEPVSEAQAAATYLQARGIERQRIILEETSHSTVESLRNAVSVINAQQDGIGIVTSRYHLFRALFDARKLGMAQVQGISAGGPSRFFLGCMVRESFALVKDFWVA